MAIVGLAFAQQCGERSVIVEIALAGQVRGDDQALLRIVIENLAAAIGGM